MHVQVGCAVLSFSCVAVLFDFATVGVPESHKSLFSQETAAKSSFAERFESVKSLVFSKKGRPDEVVSCAVVVVQYCI